MNTAPVELALGTVQFGLAYGVAGRAQPVPETEVRAILRRAHDAGVHTLDTAAAYGDIESRLAGLCGDLPFDIVSKIAPLPAGLDTAQTTGWVTQQVAQSIDRLGARLKSLLFHRAEDLLGSTGQAAWSAAQTLAARHGFTLGVSVYEVEVLQRACAHFPVALAQLPGNALDQRPASLAAPGVELHLRSAFLQGLLLMPLAAAVERVPRAAAALRNWHDWCAAQDRSPLQAALGAAKAMPQVHKVVVGVDSLAQFDEIAAAWRSAPALAAPSLACDDLDVIDPRRWGAR